MPHLSTFRLYLLGVTLLFAAYVALEYNKPKPLDWTPTYANKDKIPYGTFVLYDQLPRLLGTDSVEAVRLPIYTQLTGQSLGEAAALAGLETDTTTPHADSVTTEAATDSTEEVAAHVDDEDEESGAITAETPLRPEQASYLFVNQSFDVSRLDALLLLHYVARGNDAFIAAESFGDYRSFFSDTLGFRSEEVELPTHRGPKGLPVADSVSISFTNPALPRARYRLPGSGNNRRFVVDSGRVGRTLATDAQGRPVYIRLDHGRGHFYLCSVPVAFTNYYLLRPRTSSFAAAALTYLPARQAWWDEFQKQGPLGEQSLLRVLVGHEALRTAYYLTLLGTLLFVLVEARRRQRIIPTLKALPNTTLLFTRTVASLYRQGSSHTLIAEKKVSLFQDYLRTRFHENQPDFNDEDFRERLSQKTGMPRPRIDELLRLVNFARTAPQMNDRELLILSKALSDFRREAR
jgi:hypothetical protein